MQLKLRAAFPVAGICVKRCNLLKAQFLIVVRAHPLGRVNRAFLKRGVNLAARNIGCHATEPLEHQAAKTTGAEFHALDVSQ